MSIPQWALESAVKGILTDAEKDGKVETLAKGIEGFMEGFFPGKEKQMTQILAERVILPLGNRLLKKEK